MDPTTLAPASQAEPTVVELAQPLVAKTRTYEQHFAVSDRDLREPFWMAAVEERMARRVERYAESHGYRMLRHRRWIENNPSIAPGTSTYMVTCETDLEARWDGVWGDLRAQLAEDGLLPPKDADSRPGLPGPAAWYPPADPPDPSGWASVGWMPKAAPSHVHSFAPEPPTMTAPSGAIHVAMDPASSSAPTMWVSDGKNWKSVSTVVPEEEPDELDGFVTSTVAVREYFGTWPDPDRPS